MAQDPEELVPPAVRIALRNAVGGWGPYTVREIEELFQSHGFMDLDPSIPDEGGGIRRTTVEQFHAQIDWTSRDQAQRFLTLISDVLEHYPEEEDAPGSPGRNLRRALTRAGFRGTDGSLRLSSGAPTRVEPDVAGIWIPDRPRIFLSHVSSAKEQVSDLAAALETFQCSCFVAHIQIEPSRDWQDVIETALHTCHVLVAWVTPDFHDSLWTDQEVGWALGRRIQVIPVNVGLQPYGLFGVRQSLPGVTRAPWDVALDVFETIAAPSLRSQLPAGSVDAPLVARTVVSAFCESPSYESTRQRFPILDRIPPHLWTNEMLEQLTAATESNNQIREANLRQPQMSAPNAVRELVSRVRAAASP